MENSLEPTATCGPTPADPLHADEEMHLAYERVIQNLPASSLEPLEPVNLNVAVLVTAVLGAFPGIWVHRETLGQLATFDIAEVDQLKERVLALAHAYGTRRAAPDDIDDVPEFARTQRAVRDRLHADATALGKRGLLDEKLLERLHGGKAHQIVPFDVLSLVQVFLHNWDAIEGKTAVTLAELDAARRSANRLIAALGKRKRPTPAVDPNDVIYRQLYTWVVRTYADVRSAVQFIRRKQGDAELIAPSIFPGPRKRSRKAGSAAATTETAGETADASDTATESAPREHRR